MIPTEPAHIIAINAKNKYKKKGKSNITYRLHYSKM